MDHDRKGLEAGESNSDQGVYGCDFRKKLQQFRFIGAAGKDVKFVSSHQFASFLFAIERMKITPTNDLQ